MQSQPLDDIQKSPSIGRFIRTVLIGRMLQPARVKTEIDHISRNLERAPQAHLKPCNSTCKATSCREAGYESLWSVNIASCRRYGVSHRIEEINERQGFFTTCFPVNDAEAPLLV